MDDDLLRKVFNKFDTDRTGSLSRRQFIRMLIKLQKTVSNLRGMEMKRAEIAFEIFDTNHDNELSFSEFVEWWTCNDRYSYICGEKADTLATAYKIFTKFSTVAPGGHRRMTAYEFYNMQTELNGEDVNMESTDEVFEEIDADGNGSITFDEFVEWTEWF